MLFKRPNKNYLEVRTGLRFFLISEAVLFVTSYVLWAECNRSQASRKYFHDSKYFSWVLEFYYKTGEVRGTKAIREFDQTTWAAETKLLKAKEQ